MPKTNVLLIELNDQLYSVLDQIIKYSELIDKDNNKKIDKKNYTILYIT